MTLIRRRHDLFLRDGKRLGNTWKSESGNGRGYMFSLPSP